MICTMYDYSYPYMEESWLHSACIQTQVSQLLRRRETERGSGFFGTMVSSGGERVSVIAREALVIDCDFLLWLLFS